MSFSLASRIGLMQVVGAVDTPALRSRLGGLMGGLEPPPGRLPPSAVLLVNKLDDPAPGTISPRSNAGDADWRAALHRRLEQVARGAARPRRGLVPSSAEAVLFQDESELRACLALALIRGRQGSWWCRLPLSHYGPLATRPAALIGAEPRQLPETWSMLVHWLEPHERLAAFSETECRQLLGLMLAERGLSRLIVGLRLEQAAQQLMPSARLVPALAFWRELLGPVASRRLVQTEAWVAQAPILLLLTGLAEAIHRSHFRVRQPSFASDLALWWRALTDVEREASTAGPDPNAPRFPRADERRALDSSATPMPELSQSSAGQGRAKPAPAQAETAAPVPPVQADARHPFGLGPEPAAHAAREHGPAVGDAESAPSLRAGTVDAPDQLAPAHAAAAESAEAPTAEEGERHYPGWETLTQLGGLFFLINAMNSLGLPDDLEQHPLWGLGAWAQLELLARGLLEPLAPDLASDPIWRLLAQLDGREPDQPLGLEQAPLPGPDLPPSWIAALGPQAVVPAPLPGPEASLLAGLPPAWCEVARRCAAFLRRRFEVSGIALAELESVFRKPARIYASRAHLDVVLALEDVSLPARIAGLDKNPGWLPSFGRVIGFHYH